MGSVPKATGRTDASEAPASQGAAGFRFSTDALPDADRVGMFREAFGQKMLRLDMEALTDRKFHTDATVRSLPGLDAVWSASSPVRVSRTKQLLSDGNDNLVFQWADSAGYCKHLGREFTLGPCDAVVLSCCDSGSVTFRSTVKLMSFSVPRNILGPSLREEHACLARPVPAASSALRLLVRYLEFLREECAAAAPELQGLAAAHLCDLLAVALGATRDAAEIAKGRGVRAVRLRAIKADIARNLADGDFSVADLSARHRLTPRYVQMLFEFDGTTLTAFVREQRLARAYRMLASVRFDDRRISDIALACGFGDISYFNRSFRARYGVTPSDVKHRRLERKIRATASRR
jgi:AraC-like DNA-binding protein